MSTFTPENIGARKIALWVCSVVGLIFVGVLASKTAIGLFLFSMKNSVATILFLTLFTGVMHSFRMDLRIPAVALTVVSIAALIVLFFGGIR